MARRLDALLGGKVVDQVATSFRNKAEFEAPPVDPLQRAGRRRCRCSAQRPSIGRPPESTARATPWTPLSSLRRRWATHTCVGQLGEVHEQQADVRGVLGFDLVEQLLRRDGDTEALGARQDEVREPTLREALQRPALSCPCRARIGGAVGRVASHEERMRWLGEAAVLQALVNYSKHTLSVEFGRRVSGCVSRLLCCGNFQCVVAHDLAVESHRLGQLQEDHDGGSAGASAGTVTTHRDG